MNMHIYKKNIHFAKIIFQTFPYFCIFIEKND